MNSFLTCVLFLLHSTYCHGTNNRPIIGIIGQPVAHAGDTSKSDMTGTSYINSDYVKFVEAAGARVVPIPSDISADKLTTLFSYINGVLLPGGNEDLMKSTYRRITEHMMHLAIKAYNKGDHFPIWGTCLGLQVLAVVIASSDIVITPSYGTWDRAMKLNFTNVAHTSKMFSKVPFSILKILALDKVTHNVHHNCVSTDSYKKSHRLQKFFKVLSTNTDDSGKVFISTMEGRRYPFYAVQWHPEMALFNFHDYEGIGPHINHSKEAILASQYMADFFVNEARKSSHQFPDKYTEEKHLIYNYAPFHSGLHDNLPEQIYIF